MTMKFKNKSSQKKKTLHPLNRHRNRYDFKELIASCAELKAFVKLNQHGIETIDFSNPLAVKTLNKALLFHFYDLRYWDIPPKYLCPPVPSRADYIHYVAELLSNFKGGRIPRGKRIRVLDVGVGANCIYPLIGHQEYGWSFVGSDIDNNAISSAQKNIDNNSFSNVIELRHQKKRTNFFRGIIKKEEYFDLTICNPPFHASAKDARAANLRKRKNLGIEQKGRNFGGQSLELWYEGGELKFVSEMIKESAEFSSQCLWFSTLISKKDNLPKIHHLLQQQKVAVVKTMDMKQGQKTSRILAWSFLKEKQRKIWREYRW